MGGNTKPMVEVSHRCTTNLGGRSTGVEQAQKAIGNALLGQIKMVDIGEKSDRLQGLGYISPREFSHLEVVPNS